MDNDGYHAPPVSPGTGVSGGPNVVYPKTWYEAYQYLLRKFYDPSAPDVSFRDLPKPEGSIDEIVSVQPMTAPVPDGLFVWVKIDNEEGGLK